MTAPIDGFQPGSSRIWSLGDPDHPDISFNGTDAYGVQWVLPDPKGWHASPPSSLGLQDKPADGAWFGRGAYKARVLEVEGAFRVRAGGGLTIEEHVEAAVARLQEALDPRRDTLLAVTEKIPKQLTVRPSSEVDAHPVQGQPRTRRFSFVLTAADPFKYAAGADGLQSRPLLLANPQLMPGITHPLTHPVIHGPVPPEGLGGQLTIDYPGNEPGWPVLIFDGPVAGPTLINATSGERFALRTALAADQSAVIDTEMRTVRISGVSRLREKEVGSRFWQLAKGPNDVRFTADVYNPASRARVTFRPRWK